MSLDPPAYIVSLQNNIRGRPISWEGAVRAKTITEAELKQIKSIDKVRPDVRRQTIEKDVDGFVRLFFGGAEGGEERKSIFTAAANRQDITQYLLVLISDILEGIEAFTTALKFHPDPYKPLLPLLKQSSNPEEPVPLLAAYAMSGAIAHTLDAASKTSPQIAEALPKLNAYLAQLAASSDSGIQDIAVQQYSAVLRNRKTRELFWQQRSETLAPLVEILRAAAGPTSNGGGSGAASSNGRAAEPASSRASVRSAGTDGGLSGGVGIQLLYHVLLVVWQLSFEAALVGKGLDGEHDIVTLYTALLRVSPKEKLTRLLLATLANLFAAEGNRAVLLPAAAAARLPALLANLKGRHLTDDDLVEDLEALRARLEEYAAQQTTFSVYADEVRGGRLRWSPPHRSAAFWAENARRVIDEDKGELVAKLAEVLGKAWEGEKAVLAIACNDVGWLVKECADRKSVLEKAGLKVRVMALMQDEDEAVRWEALRAVGEWMRYSMSSER